MQVLNLAGLHGGLALRLGRIRVAHLHVHRRLVVVEHRHLRQVVGKKDGAREGKIEVRLSEIKPQAAPLSPRPHGGSGRPR